MARPFLHLSCLLDLGIGTGMRNSWVIAAGWHSSLRMLAGQVWGGREGMWRNTRKYRMSVCVRRLVILLFLLMDSFFRTTTTAKHMKTLQCNRPLTNVHDMLPLFIPFANTHWPGQPSTPYISANVLHENEREQKIGAQT